eukprot:TRINITY_DN979_c1_g1_i1.p1 TRINITY_DN979_c1_g1~~TRINITY_DN979_c1_g1_i1.p1  ORF type:complete len:775 (+),score=288.38 TRINITY_DN979_c1_g1_i1:97-2421(+)
MARMSPEAIVDSLTARLPPRIPGESKPLLHIVTGDVNTAPAVMNGRDGKYATRPVALTVTDYRLVVLFFDERYEPMEIPIMAIEEVKEPKRSAYQHNTEEVAITTKLPWDVRLRFVEAQLVHEKTNAYRFYNLLSEMKRMYFVTHETAGGDVPLRRMFAFNHHKAYLEEHKEQDLTDGWGLFDVNAELNRQTGGGDDDALDPAAGKADAAAWEGMGVGANLRPWFRVAHIDKQDEGFSPTYPSRFVVPRNATDKLVREVASFRSRARVPLISYVSLRTGAVIARCSQPLPGLALNSRSQGDEVMCTSLMCQAYTREGTSIPSCFRDESDAPGEGAAAAAGKKKGMGNSPSSPTRPPPSLSGSGPPPSLSGGPPPTLSGGFSRNSSPSHAAEGKTQTSIYDARSQIAATANRGRGGGYESSKHYNCKLHFLCMENIHAVKSSWKKVKKCIEGYNNIHSAAKDAVPQAVGPNTGFQYEWEKTGWVLHVQRLLYGSLRIVEDVMAGVPCLVHCSDGWDRTSQLTSTAMLLLDPYYRSVEGFALLIEREWCVPGHKFAERSGHQVEGLLSRKQLFREGEGNELEDESSDKSGIAKHTKTGSGIEPSPVFLQWMDALFQLTRQFPTAFEFAPAMLEYIMVNVYSCRFGTFLCNFDKERIGEGVKEQTLSIWTELLRLSAEEKRTGAFKLVNQRYDASLTRVLRPTCNAKRMAVWESFYFRHDVERSRILSDPPPAPAAPSAAALQAKLAAAEKALREAQAKIAQLEGQQPKHADPNEDA